MVIRNFRRKRELMSYNRDNAVEYAHKWVFGRNPAYYNFDNVGGDCTSFASQAIYAGSGVMNYTPTYGWYYLSSYDRTASWTGVDFLYKFLVGNKGPGPVAEQVDTRNIRPGDIVQLSFDGGNLFNHSPVVVSTGSRPGIKNILIAAHTYDVDNYPLSRYEWKDIRFLHIKGVRK